MCVCEYCRQNRGNRGIGPKKERKEKRKRACKGMHGCGMHVIAAYLRRLFHYDVVKAEAKVRHVLPVKQRQQSEKRKMNTADNIHESPMHFLTTKQQDHTYIHTYIYTYMYAVVPFHRCVSTRHRDNSRQFGH